MSRRTGVARALWRFFSITAMLATLLEGCAHLPAGKGEKPDVLLADACRPGAMNQATSGSVWMSLKSKEEKGQFPASVSAEAPDKVTLEVTNLIGTREALIQVNHGSYTIDVPNKRGGSSRRGKGSGSWGGIPLRWASELFLGRIPCPAGQPARLQTTPDGDLVVESHGERFVYHFREWAGRPWPEKLHWERIGVRVGHSMRGTASVDFKFDDPDDKTGSPKKWEAKSSRGEVKLRWTDLQVTPRKSQ